MLDADYLIVGAGAMGMIFADQLLTETDARIVMIDRHAAPGGHWNDAYGFVRLHQPSAFYGVGSRELGERRIDTLGVNAGYYELASGAEVLSYFDKVMQERFLPSGRVIYLPLCEHLGDGRCVSRVSGETRTATFRRLVDTTFFDTAVPSTHTPSFAVADGVRLVTPNALPSAVEAGRRCVILGGGKTAMDAAGWLLQMGAAPDALRWIVPRDAWVINRDTTQPGDAFVHRTAGGQASLFEAAADASSMDDLFDRLEAAGLLLRVDPSVRPTMYRGATISVAEVESLRRIRDVERLGHVRRLEPERIMLDHGSVEARSDDLYIDCTARALGSRPTTPVFAGERITLQPVRAGLISFSAAFIAHVEAAYTDEAEKNDLCAPIPPASTTADWLRLTLADLRNSRRWSADRALRAWIAGHRLSGFGGEGPPDAALTATRQRLRDARPRAEANLERLLRTGPG